MIGRRILIVEDEPVLVRALTDALEARGCDVISALDGERGLELALEKKPQLILLDIMLPRVNGFEICRAVREHGHDMLCNVVRMECARRSERQRVSRTLPAGRTCRPRPVDAMRIANAVG